ncbi:MAG TPA: ATP-binding protein [Chloroflexia bacterium]|nr:ATP-binding protein [Chloroflexia bacterium]
MQEQTSNIETPPSGPAAGAPVVPRSCLLLVAHDGERLASFHSAFAAMPDIELELTHPGDVQIEPISVSKYAAVVLDYTQADEDASGLLDQLCKAGVPVIAITSADDPGAGDDAIKRGADDYLASEEGYLRRLPQAVTGAVRRNRLHLENRLLMEQVRQQSNTLQAVMESDPGAIAVLRGEDLRFELVNPSYRKLVRNFGGIHPFGKPVDEVFPNPRNPQVRAALTRVYETGEAESFTDVAYSNEAGQSRHFTTHIIPLSPGGSAQERGVVIIIWDITDEVDAREKVEALAAEAEAQRFLLQTVIDQMPEGIYIASAPEGEILFVNQAAIELMGAPLLMNIFDPDATSVLRLLRPDGSELPPGELPLQRAISAEEFLTGVELCYIDSKGARLDLLCNASPIYDAHAQLIAGVMVFQDITSLKDLERVKQEFISIASHELRTPLTSVKATAQLMLRRAQRSEHTNQDVASIKAIAQQASRMSRLIDEMLDTARLQSGVIQIEPAVTDLVPLVEEVVADSRISYPEARFNLSLPVELAEQWVNADRDRIAQVLSNLVENAVKYSPVEAKITLSVSPDPFRKLVEVTVSDDGVGFDPSQKELIFERFSRLDSVANHSKGMGLGLYICRQIIERHNGSISAFSEGPGQGSAFSFTLPLVDNPDGQSIGQS